MAIPDITVGRYSGANGTSGVMLSGVTIGLDATTASSRTSGGLSAGTYHVSNSVWCHIKTGDGTVNAAISDTLLAPGERLLLIEEGLYVAVIKATGQADGILRISRLS